VNSGPTFDLVLLGYRNDLARERTIGFLRRAPYPCQTVERDTALPVSLLAGIDHEIGLRLGAELRGLGAQVRLVAAEPTAPQPRVESAAGRRRMPRPALLLLLGLASGLYLHTQRSRPHPAPEVRAPEHGEVMPARWPVSAAPETGLQLNNEAVALSAEGDFAGAAARLRAAVAQQPEQPMLRQNLKAVLHNWAITELNAGHPAAALDLANEALGLGEDPHLLLVVGVAHSRNAEWGPAQAALERALAVGATDPYALVTLGQVYRQQGNRAGAVEMFQRARERGGAGSQLDETLRRLERELDAEWDYAELPSPHFVISFAYGENYEAARAVLSSLENAYVSVGYKLDFHPSNRVSAVLYDSEDFHDVTQTPSWMGAVYDGRIKLPVHDLDQRHPRFDATVRHEYAHALVNQLSMGRCPVWLNEGIAIWAEEDTEGERTKWAEATIAAQPLFYLQQLNGPFTGLSEKRVPVAYAQSYLAVRALLDEFGARRLRELLTTLAAGTPMPSAFENIFSRSLTAFEDQLLRNLTG